MVGCAEKRKRSGGSSAVAFPALVLLVFGSDGIKRDGLFDRVASSLKENGITFEELGGHC